MTIADPPLALITGATAGIGAEFARQLAAGGVDLVLVARDALRLEEGATGLREEFGVTVEVLAADLVSPADLAAVETRLEASAGRRVTMLGNNAGFGLLKPFDENPIEDEQRLLDLLVTAPMRLSHAALRQMLPAGSGTIVNIASVAGYTPRGTYGASKAWVLSFSRWANLTYRRRGVTVTAVAPGFVHTEFHDRMNVSKDGVPAFLWLDPPTLVRLALRDVAKGRAVSIPTLRYKIVVLLSGLLPKRIVAAGALRGR
ncbi:SDR family NAD(P)-dependent oxidoreductase [Lacisediminihabitans sp. FW035]